MSKKIILYLKQMVSSSSNRHNHKEKEDGNPNQGNTSVRSGEIYLNTKKKIIETSKSSVKVHPKGLAYYLHKSMKKHASNIAQIDASTGDAMTYEEFLASSEGIATELSNRGVMHFDVVCFCSSNNMNLAIAFVAALLIGARTVSLEPTMAFADVEMLLKQIKPKMIFVECEVEEMIMEINTKWTLGAEVVAFDFSRKNSMILNFNLKSNGKFCPYVVKSMDEVALIAISSGSVDPYKCICFNHYTILHYAIDMCFGSTLEFCTLYQVSSLLSLLSCIVYGFPRIVSRKFTPSQMWQYIEIYRVAYLYLTPYQAAIFFEWLPKDHTSSLKYLAIGGDGISSERLIAYSSVMPKTVLFILYGQCEIPLPFQLDYKTQHKIGCAGSPKYGFSYKIVKPGTDELLDPLVVGELRIKTKQCMSHYYNSPLKSKIWDSDGYIKTGDLAYYDRFLYFFIVGNMNEMIRYQGTVFRPLKVESVIMKHPEVEFCAVIGVTLPGQADKVVAFVTPNQNSKLKPSDVEEFIINEAPAKYQVISNIVFLDYLPLTPSGKVSKRMLRNLYIKNNSD